MSVDEIQAPQACPIGCDVDTSLRSCPAVVKIENAPYGVTRQEVKQLFGQTARLTENWPIHILMERSTGKTTDCYVEFASDIDAEEAIQRIQNQHDGHQGPRMGNRLIEVTMSSPDALMKAVFPLTKGIKWERGRPVQVLKREDEFWSTGFDGFLTDEELFCTARHAREPNRSIFSSKVPQRPYESIISTIWMFPWYAADMYTVHTRNKLFVTLKEMIAALVERLKRKRDVGLDQRLVSELLNAGIQCPAFTPRMKYVLAEVTEDVQILNRMHPQAVAYFPFDTLTWLRPYDIGALDLYGSLIALGRPLALPRGLYPYEVSRGNCALYGEWWFGWEDNAAKAISYAAAVSAEKEVLRQLLVAGYNVQRSGLLMQSAAAPASAASRSSPSANREQTSQAPQVSATHDNSGDVTVAVASAAARPLVPRSFHERFLSEPSRRQRHALFLHSRRDGPSWEG
ncbi:hypothetical protein PDE_03377 [Penicillium oxalicum 114-2]|uniref:RRM domain-containing protein n=1 Tax=Penicillium oxalicum (strain 114-2 / CGMCC 5302) TaxID=933388 RepID=S7ZIB7_PENO1|nr:hypothetical protein PDE_03377 [Penicillium oxalicum 114-2]